MSDGCELRGRIAEQARTNIRLRREKAELEDTIKTWKDWHDEIIDALGLRFRERNATLKAIRELVARGEGES